MKNILCAFTIVLLSIIKTTPSLSQPTTWAQPGAHWYYTIGDSVPIGYYGYFELWEEGDTLFSNGITCDIIRTHEKYIQFWSGGTIGENYGPAIYTYMSNDTVYCYYQNQFYVLFVNNVQTGESWISGPDIYNVCAGDTIVIDSVMAVNINGVNMNRYVPIVPSWSMPNAPEIYFHSPIYERFGSTGFFLPVPMCVTDISFGPIRCYSDSSGFTYTLGAVPSCDYVTSVEDELTAHPVFIITPNPAKEEITINSDVSIIATDEIGEIYNALGSKVATFIITKSVQQMNISNLLSGNYFIKIKNRPQMKPVRFVKL